MNTELFVLSGSDAARVMASAEQVAERAGEVPLGALSMQCAEQVDPAAPFRLGVVARSAAELRGLLGQLQASNWADAAPGVSRHPTGAAFWCVAPSPKPTRIGFVYPGHGCQRLDMGRTLVDSFPWARLMLRQADEVLSKLGAPTISETTYRPDTESSSEEDDARFQRLSHVEAAGPAIIFASALWTRYLEIIGVRPAVVAGHSGGEQCAFFAAGAVDLSGLMLLSAFLGRAGSPNYNPDAAGIMTVFACPIAVTEELLADAGGYAIIVAHNGPEQATVAGERTAVERAMAAATQRGIEVRPLPVSNAFHTRLVAEGGDYMKAHCPELPPVGKTAAKLISSLNAEPVGPETLPLDHFVTMVTNPIRFEQTARVVAREVDFFIELGPGATLSGLMHGIDADWTCLPIEPKPGHTRALHCVAAALFAYGAPVKWPLFFRTTQKAWGCAKPS